MEIEITGSGYELLKKSPICFEVYWSIPGVLTFMPCTTLVIGSDEEDVRKMFSIKHPERRIETIKSNK